MHSQPSQDTQQGLGVKQIEKTDSAQGDPFQNLIGGAGQGRPSERGYGGTCRDGDRQNHDCGETLKFQGVPKWVRAILGV